MMTTIFVNGLEMDNNQNDNDDDNITDDIDDDHYNDDDEVDEHDVYSTCAHNMRIKYYYYYFTVSAVSYRIAVDTV